MGGSVRILSLEIHSEFPEGCVLCRMNDSKFIKFSFKFPAKSYANHLFETLVFDRLEMSKSRHSFSIFVLKTVYV